MVYEFLMNFNKIKYWRLTMAKGKDKGNSGANDKKKPVLTIKEKRKAKKDKKA